MSSTKAFARASCYLAVLVWLAGVSSHGYAATFDLPPDGGDVVGEIQVVVAKSSDTLLDIARHYDLGYNEITAANPGVDPWLPKDGTYIIVPTRFVLPDAPRRGLVLNIPQMRLYYFVAARGNEPAKVITHPIGIGREYWGTPLGNTFIAAKKKNPSWYPPASVRKEHASEDDPLPGVIPPGPNNPLGDYALQLGIPGYLIHGTNRPWGVGMRVSHGCIRMYPEDIQTLFAQVRVRTPVEIVNQPYVAGWRDGQLWLQAFPPLPEDNKDLPDQTQMMSVILGKVGEEQAVDWDKAAAAAQEKLGIPLPVLPGAPDLLEIISSAIDSAAIDTSNPEPQATPSLQGIEAQ